MASATSWEVVGKSKKGKGESKKLSPAKEQQLLDKMPKLSRNGPVEIDETVYSVFMPKEKPQTTAPIVKEDAGNKQNGNKKPANQKKKKQDDQKKKQKPVRLEAALSGLDSKNLESVINLSKSYFPNHPLIWLKDVASSLNIELENTYETDPVYKGKSTGFPLDAVPTAYANVLHSFMKQFSKQTLDNIYYYNIQTMLQESAKGIPVHGYKILLQLLAQTKPDIIMDKLPQYLEILKMNQNNPSKCLSVLWAVGQCGFKNFNCGLKVWLNLMLPALEVKQVAAYPVDYLEALIRSSKKNGKKSFGLVTLRDYFQVMDVFFGPKFTLPSDLKKRLIVCYPFIKTLAFGEEPSHNLRTFFPSYLTRFSTTKYQPMKDELLECMTHCLITDKQSFSVWCQLYTKHLSASSHLLEHINRKWSKLSSKFDKKILTETLRSFSVTNDELEIQSKGKQDGLKQCQSATKILLTKLTGSSFAFPWSLLVFLLVSVFAAIVVYDIMSSPKFHSSKTMLFLEHYGILAFLKSSYQCVLNAITLSTNWLKVNFPVYYAYVCDTMGPFLIMVWETTRDFIINAEVASRPHRALMVEKAFQLYHWVYDLSPDFWIRCGEISLLAWEILKDYTLRIWKHSLHFAGEAEHWLTEHVLTGSFSKEMIKDTALRGVEHLQNCTTNFVTWTKAYFLATK